ncbi:MAG: hypothetical protein OQK54_06715, partial [Gammaproteobacteria bacterium]|nr:hypothetical protein [Gammaproteobacteria bacterium]
MFSEGKQGGFKGQGVSAYDLPVPSEAALAHSERLQVLIRDEIEHSGGHIGFERFMELALYAPGLGYYSAGS